MNNPFAGLTPAALATLQRLAPNASIPAGVKEEGNVTFADGRAPIHTEAAGPDPYSEESWNQEIAARGYKPPSTTAAAGGYGAGAKMTAEDDAAKEAEAQRLIAQGNDPAVARAKAGLPDATSTTAPPAAPPAAGGAQGAQGAGVQQSPMQYIPPTPAVTIPAHWQPGQHTVSTQRPIDQESLEQGRFYRDQAQGARLLAADKELAASQMRGVADAAYAYGNTMASQRYAADLAKIQQDRASYVKNEADKLESMSLAAQQKIDPEQWSKQQGAGGNALAAIAIGLGQFGALMRGGPNTAWDIIKSKVDANIAGQVKNVENARHAYDVESNLYAQNLAAFGDKDRAALATKLAYLDQMKGMVDQQYASAKTRSDEASYNELMGKINDARADAAYEFNQRSGIIAEQGTEHYVPAQTVGGGGGFIPRDKNTVALPDGTTIVVPEDVHKDSVVAIQTLSDLLAITNDVKAKRAEMKELLKSPYENYEKIAAARKTLEDLTERQIYAESNAAKQGVVREGEYPRAARNAGGTAGLGVVGSGSLNPAHAWAQGVDQMLDSKQQFLNDKLEREIKATGGQVVETGYARDARTGGLKPVMRYTGRDVQAPQQVAPAGTRAMDPRRPHVPQAGPVPVGEAARQKPIVGVAPTPSPAPKGRQ